MDFKDHPTLDYLDVDGTDELGYEDELAEIAAASSGYTDDSVKVYMREMGKFQLLDKAQEVELAKRIEAGHRTAHEATFSTALAITEIRKLLYKIVTAKKRASDIIDMHVSSTSTQHKEKKLREQVKKVLGVLDALEMERLTTKPTATSTNGKRPTKKSKNRTNLIKTLEELKIDREEISKISLTSLNRQSIRLARGKAKFSSSSKNMIFLMNGSTVATTLNRSLKRIQ